MAAAASILAFGLGGDIRLDGLASERMGEVSKLVAAFPYFFGGTMTNRDSGDPVPAAGRDRRGQN